MAAYESALSYYETITSTATTIATILAAIVVWLLDKHSKERNGSMVHSIELAIVILSTSAIILYMVSISAVSEIAQLQPNTEVELRYMGFLIHLLVMYIGVALVTGAAYVLLSGASRKRDDEKPRHPEDGSF